MPHALFDDRAEEPTGDYAHFAGMDRSGKKVEPRYGIVIDPSLAHRVADAVDAANTDMVASVDGTIDSLNSMASTVMDLHKKLQESVRRNANQMAMNQV